MTRADFEHVVAMTRRHSNCKNRDVALLLVLFATAAKPLEIARLKVGDIVLVRVHGHEYLHLIKAIQGQRFLIGNNRGGVNGWVGGGSIFGAATKVERP